MNAFSFEPGQRWVFVFPHPDDELAVAAFIRRLCLGGAEVHILWLHHTPVRKAESTAVCIDLGVEENRLHFWHGEDGRLCEQMAEALPWLNELMAAIEPDRVATCAFEQGHLDHDATHVLVRRAFAGTVLEFPLYYGYHTIMQRMNRFSDPARQTVLPLTAEEIRLKKSWAKRYPSQTIYRVLCTYHLCCGVLGQPAKLATREVMRPTTTREFLVPNHSGWRRHRLEVSDRWVRWTLAYREFEREYQPSVGLTSSPAAN